MLRSMKSQTEEQLALDYELRFARLGGFREMEIKKRFLPYTMAKGLQPPIAFLRLYLKMPLVWRFFGGQFLVFARKS
jgi:hypothetical protein